MKVLSLIFLIGIFFLSLFYPLFFVFDPYGLDLSRAFLSPSMSHIFGLDQEGKDLFLQVILGARISLFITFSVILVSLLIGLILGTLAGYLEGIFESVIMSLVDMVLAFPKFLMALALVAMLGGSLFHLIFALSFSTWATFARLVRAEVRHLKKKEFVLQARSQGASHLFLIIKHIWPSLFGIVSIHAVFQAAGVLIAESGLSFLGLGTSLNNPSWGMLLGEGRHYMFEAPHLIYFPSLFLFLFLLSLNVFAEDLRKKLKKS